MIEGFKHAGILGCNVTMPCKRAVIPYLDELSPEAELMQTVNVIHFKDGKAKGYNTDGPGYVRVLQKAGVDIPNATLTILGPGGAGTPIIVSTALEGVKKVNVFARKNGASYNATKELLPRLAEKAPSSEVVLHDFADGEAMATAIQESDALVNCTNVGMGEGCTDTPVPAELLHGDLVVADVIYMPPETQLLRDAAAAGCRTFNGLGMLDQQAVAADLIRFGIEILIDEVRAELSAGA